MAANLESGARNSRLLLKIFSRASTASYELQLTISHRAQRLLTVSIAIFSYKTRFLGGIKPILISLATSITIRGDGPTRLHFLGSNEQVLRQPKIKSCSS